MDNQNNKKPNVLKIVLITIFSTILAIIVAVVMLFQYVAGKLKETTAAASYAITEYSKQNNHHANAQKQENFKSYGFIPDFNTKAKDDVEQPNNNQTNQGNDNDYLKW
ncbi:hypothetical protein [Francisella sp. TX07-6608]|uniref:hypothetical protein n=1 Tax=Francisella sp. TX07-6608 TaxID=573568 RepID=UPI0008F98F97|nr:hypothetical protein [Francisella sp. TX07-6608]OIN82886.1 hypothetical protein KX00_2044 [Francisella sp. TX07-6608]